MLTIFETFFEIAGTRFGLPPQVKKITNLVNLSKRTKELGQLANSNTLAQRAKLEAAKYREQQELSKLVNSPA